MTPIEIINPYFKESLYLSAFSQTTAVAKDKSKENINSHLPYLSGENAINTLFKIGITAITKQHLIKELSQFFS